MSDITVGYLSDQMQLPPEPQKALIMLFSNMQNYSPRPEVVVQLVELPFKERASVAK